MTRITIATTSGPLTGRVDCGVCIFKGVRYGSDPSALGRFRRPKPIVPRLNGSECYDFAPSCPQPRRIRGVSSLRQLGIPVMEQHEGEDCLALNVWAPAHATCAPALVWFHSGLSTGSGSWPWYDGAQFARAHGVVVVSLNTRIGPLGYLDASQLLGDEYSESGNVGVLDCIAALKWLVENLTQFGGDPARITIGGGCAGAARVHALLATRAADGLFVQAIVQSRQGPDVVNRDIAARNASQVWRGSPQSVRTASAWSLAERAAQSGIRLGPVADGNMFRGSMFEYARPVPMLIGFNQDETVPPGQAPTRWTGTTESDLVERLRPLLGGEAEETVRAELARLQRVSMRDIYERISGLHECVKPTKRLAELNEAHNGATFMYRFDWTTTLFGSRPRTPHGIDVPFALGNVRNCPIAARDPAAEELSASMSEAWAAFIRSGRPTASSLPSWPDYGQPGKPTLVISSEPHIRCRI